MKLTPAIIQNSETKEVLMLGYMNATSLKKTRTTKKVWFYSRSKKRLWMKGETSGNTLIVNKIAIDCDRDTLLIFATPKGPTCHTGRRSCFLGTAQPAVKSQIFDELFELILERKKNPTTNSYTSFLFKKGLLKICAKVKEESGEVIKAAKKETKKRLIEESVDVLYHLFVLDAARGIQFDDLMSEIKKRRR